MFLAVDVGNTQTVVGVYEGDELKASWRLKTVRDGTSDDICARMQSLMAMQGLDMSAIHHAALASVVPALKEAWADALCALCGTEALLCTAASAGALFQADYPHPEEIGADRVADAVACKAKYGFPSVVVDFGTATNIEVIDERGMFIGGIIAPGLQTSASTLISSGAQLFSVDLSAPEHAIGRNTREALESGILFGEAARVDGLVSRIFQELGYEARVIATGGLASRIAHLSKRIDEVDPDLTLEGLRLISEADRF